jgi:hypothetical protein
LNCSDCGIFFFILLLPTYPAFAFKKIHNIVIYDSNIQLLSSYEVNIESYQSEVGVFPRDSNLSRGEILASNDGKTCFIIPKLLLEEHV